MNEAVQRKRGRRPKTEIYGSTRDLLLATAARLFMQSGYPVVTIEDIARTAGVTKPAIFYHFSSKTDIFVESIGGVLGYVLNRIEPILASPSSLPDRMLSVALALLEIPAPLANFDVMLLGASPSVPEDALQALQGDLDEVFAKLERAIRADAHPPLSRADAAFLAHAFISMLSLGQLEDSHGTRPFTDKMALAHHVVDLISVHWCMPVAR